MLAYFKGSASAIIVASFSFLFITILTWGLDDAFSDLTTSFLIIIGMFGYVCGLLGQGVLYIVTYKKLSRLSRYIIFLILGIVSGYLIELFFGYKLFPLIIISTMLGSAAYLACQEIKSRMISYCLAAFPPVLFFVYTSISNVISWIG